MAQHNDPLYKLRHALAGVALALFISVLVAAMAGSLIADLFSGAYGARVAVYAGLLFYVLVGAVVLFVKVARHETAPLTARRVWLWFASLWMWPMLLPRRQGGVPRRPDL